MHLRRGHQSHRGGGGGGGEVHSKPQRHGQIEQVVGKRYRCQGKRNPKQRLSVTAGKCQAGCHPGCDRYSSCPRHGRGVEGALVCLVENQMPRAGLHEHQQAGDGDSEGEEGDKNHVPRKGSPSEF